MTTTDGLVSFLRARLDEDEQDALAQQAFDAQMIEERGLNVDAIAIPPLSQLGSPGDPARALVEVEAKRRILDLHAPVIDGTQSSWTWFAGSESESSAIVRLLALPYASHPEYRKEWAA